MRRILLVSQTFPSRFDSAVYGAQQRLRFFLEAAASISDSLDVLFFAEPSWLQQAMPRHSRPS